MKLQFNRHLALLVLSSSWLSGCAMVGEFLFPSPNMNPDSWAPQLPVSVAPQGGLSSSRPLRQDDSVTGSVRAGGAAPLEISDIIDSYGNITLPHIGEFRVGQLTTSEAEKAIRAAYISNGFFTSPDVTLVCLNTIQEKQYFITGAVAKKGSFEFRDGITLWQAIIAAGDITDFAGNKVKLVRNGVAEKYDIRKIKTGKIKDPPLVPGDMIEVLEGWL